jgi:hypothetical protein
MIIENITLRVKNVIFFKIVTISLLFIGFSYYISFANEDLIDTKIKFNNANLNLNEAHSRLEILGKNNEEMNIAITKYKHLKNTKDIPDECFDKNVYSANLRKIESKYALKNKIDIFTSSMSTIKKNQPVKTISLRTTSVNLIYFNEDFINSVKIAKEAFESLPSYNFITAFEIKRNSILTPQVMKWVEKSNIVDLISSNVTMEVKELDLNDL